MTDCGAKPLLRGLRGGPGVRGRGRAAPRAAALGWRLSLMPPSLLEWRFGGLVFFYYYYCFLRKGCLRVLVVVVGGCLRVFKRAANPQVCSPRASCAAQEIGEAPRNPRGAGLPPRQSSPFSASSRGWVCVCFLKTRARPYTHTPPSALDARPLRRSAHLRAIKRFSEGKKERKLRTAD